MAARSPRFRKARTRRLTRRPPATQCPRARRPRPTRNRPPRAAGRQPKRNRPPRAANRHLRLQRLRTRRKTRMPSTEEWIDELKGITVLELAERIKALEEEFGVSATAVAAAAPA